MKSKAASFVFLAVLAVCVFGTEAWGSEAEKDGFLIFSSQTLDGEPVTNAIFADKKLTMVNVWGTYCSP
jgi:hypothetical protein